VRAEETSAACPGGVAYRAYDGVNYTSLPGSRAIDICIDGGWKSLGNFKGPLRSIKKITYNIGRGLIGDEAFNTGRPFPFVVVSDIPSVLQTNGIPDDNVRFLATVPLIQPYSQPEGIRIPNDCPSDVVVRFTSESNYQGAVYDIPNRDVEDLQGYIRATYNLTDEVQVGSLVICPQFLQKGGIALLGEGTGFNNGRQSYVIESMPQLSGSGNLSFSTVPQAFWRRYYASAVDPHSTPQTN
jgi:hypothetical protein